MGPYYYPLELKNQYKQVYSAFQRHTFQKCCGFGLALSLSKFIPHVILMIVTAIASLLHNDGFQALATEPAAGRPW